MNFHQKAMLIGGITLLLCLFSFLWIVLLNKGTLSISGEVPFSVSAQGPALKIPEEITCNETPCPFMLPRGEYELTFSKQNYFEETLSATVKRGDTTSLSVDFQFIPTVESIGDYEAFKTFFTKPSPTADFRFEMDSTYNKQKLVYADPTTFLSTVWAYFDRPLEKPLVFPSPTLRHAIVVDQAEIQSDLYLIDGQEFDRSYWGQLANVETVVWGAAPSSDSPDILIQTVASRSGEAHWWLKDKADGALREWPVTVDSNKVVWDEEGNVIFATTQNVKELSGATLETSLDAVQLLLDQGLDLNSTSFAVAKYNPTTGEYYVLYEIPRSFNLDYGSVEMAYDPQSNQVLFTDGASVYQILLEK